MGAVNFLSQGGLLYNLIKLIHCCVGRSGETSSQTSPNDARRRPSSVSVSCTMPGLQVSWTTIVVLFVLKKKTSSLIISGTTSERSWLGSLARLCWAGSWIQSQAFDPQGLGYSETISFLSLSSYSQDIIFSTASKSVLGTWVPMGTFFRFWVPKRSPLSPFQAQQRSKSLSSHYLLNVDKTSFN